MFQHLHATGYAGVCSWQWIMSHPLSACMKKPWLKPWVSVRSSAVDGWVDSEDSLRAEYWEKSTEKHGESWERGPDVPYLLSFLVRARVRTVMCMSVDVTSGLQGTQAWASPDPGGWHRGVKSGDVVEREGGASLWSCHRLDKDTLWAPRFQQFAVKPAITSCFWISMFDISWCDGTDVKTWNSSKQVITWW